MTSPSRFALYFAPPPESVWWGFGSTWLGRDACKGEPLAQPTLRDVDPKLLAVLTADPRRYGFHATLKAPIRLAPGLERSQLVSSLRAFCATQRAFALPPLRLARLDHFIALVLAGDSARIDALAARLVEHFDRFRAAPTAEELARRTERPLSPRQRAYLDWWGYPKVFEEYRFHMSLTGDISRTSSVVIDSLFEHVRADLEQIGNAPLRVDAVCLFEEPAPGAPFTLTERIAFGSLANT